MSRSVPPKRVRRLFLVECFAATAAEVARIEGWARSLGEKPDSRHGGVYLAGLLLPEDEQLLLVVAAVAAPPVRDAGHRAGVIIDRIAELRIEPGSPGLRASVSRRAPPPSSVSGLVEAKPPGADNPRELGA